MDADRFKLRVLPLKNKLYRFASRLLEDKEEAQDAIQEVFLKLWNLGEKLYTFNSIEAFAMKVTKNHCLDRIKGRRTVSLEQAGGMLYGREMEVNTEKQAELRETAELIQNIMSLLPEQQRMIMHLRDIEGYEFEEIEQVLDVNLNTIRVNLSRARKKVREMYINSMNDGPEKSKSFTG